MQKEEVINFGVVLVFVVGFLLLSYFDTSLTGYAVKNLDDEVSVIIGLSDESSYSDKDTIKSQQDKFVKLNDLNLVEDFDNINAISVKIKRSDLDELIKDPNLESVNLDKKFSLTLDSSKSVIMADKVWDKLDNAVNLTGVGSVCVLDTGVNYNHPALVGKIILGPDYVNEDNDPNDDHGHGTHVAGTVVSLDGVNRGIANGGKVVAVKVMNSGGGGTESDILAGIDWCINNKDLYNISVISMSIGTSSLFDVCDELDPPFTNLVNEAVNEGILVVSSSGNSGSTSSLPLPACITNVTSIGAVDDNDNVASFSNSASFLDLLATGVSITSTGLGSSFVSMSGTSMAVPHAVASVLIVKQYGGLDVLSILKDTGDGVLDSRNGLTFSRVNIYKALLSLDVFDPVLNYDIPLNVYDDKEVVLVAEVVDTFLDSVWLDINNETYSGSEIVLNDLEVGDVSFRFSANDSAGNLKIGNLSNFVVLDGTPAMNNIGVLVAQVDKEFNYQVIVVDPTNDSLVYSDNSELFNISENGLISFTPESLGEFDIILSVNDRKHFVDDNFILRIITNNSNPEIVSYSPENLSVSLDENESLKFSIVKEDLDNTSLSVGWYLDGELVGNQDDYNFVTNYTSSGIYNLVVNISDGIDYDFVEWNIEVLDVNLVPQFVDVVENISFNENDEFVLDLSDKFVDVDGDVLSYLMDDVENISFNGSLIPDLEFVGNFSVKFYGCDSENCAESNLVNVEILNVPVCGNNLIEDGEECDGLNLSCLDFDYDSGSLGCSECKYEFSLCKIVSVSSGSSSGGGGSRIESSVEEKVIEKTQKIKEPLIAENVEEEEEVIEEKTLKPQKSGFRQIWEAIKEFFRRLFEWFWDFF